MTGSKDILIKITLASILVCVSFIIDAQTALRKLPMVSAHRGASKVAPENTMAAFLNAIKLGANFIEIDVRTTSDGAQVIMHDGSLKRTTGLDARVDKTSLPIIRELSAGEWFGIQYKDERVPTLEDVCELVRSENRGRDRKIKLYVDCKAINTGEVIRILNQYSLLDSAVFYGDISVLKEIRKFSEKARLMPSYPGKEKVERMIRVVKPYAFDIPYNALDEETVSHCHSKGIKVFSDLLGQADTAVSYRKAISLSVDLIQTDDVSQVLQVYKESKQEIHE
ncbi:MAG: glycerophosphodiester phosphodiesterase [Marivirga sp.]|nr:glycerophosphodiester phosphodiesterase [Marivirga sp.]